MRFRQRPRGLTRTQFFLVTAAWLATVPNAHVVKLFFDAPAAGTGLQAIVFALGGWMFIFTTAFFMLLALGLFFWGRGASCRTACRGRR